MADIQKEIIKDIATMVGATVIDNEFGLRLEDVQLKHFGSAKLIKTDQDFTHIVGGAFEKESFQKRLNEIRD
jgi:chaperonin GroEL